MPRRVPYCPFRCSRVVSPFSLTINVLNTTPTDFRMFFVQPDIGSPVPAAATFLILAGYDIEQQPSRREILYFHGTLWRPGKFMNPGFRRNKDKSQFFDQWCESFTYFLAAIDIDIDIETGTDLVFTAQAFKLPGHGFTQLEQQRPVNVLAGARRARQLIPPTLEKPIPHDRLARVAISLLR